ncbi:MAG: hypothetical protein HQK98_07445 [Nitrospirae bacterium]|nr:hypothetical protein [Nitrospirota bacterium]
MSEIFWIKDEDGKFDGSLPDVPKKGYTADGSEKENILDVSKENIPDAAAQDKKRRKTDAYIAAILEMLRKGLRLSRQGDILNKLGINPSIFSLEEITAMF